MTKSSQFSLSGTILRLIKEAIIKDGLVLHRTHLNLLSNRSKVYFYKHLQRLTLTFPLFFDTIMVFQRH